MAETTSYVLSKKSLSPMIGDMIILYKNGKAKVYNGKTDKNKLPYRDIGFIAGFNGRKIKISV